MTCYIAKVGTSTCSLTGDAPARPVTKTLRVCEGKEDAVDIIALALEGMAIAYGTSDAKKESALKELHKEFDKKNSRYVSIRFSGIARHCRFDAEIEEAEFKEKN